MKSPGPSGKSVFTYKVEWTTELADGPRSQHTHQAGQGSRLMLFMSLWSECPPKGDSEVTEALCKVIRFWRRCSQKGSMLVFQSQVF